MRLARPSGLELAQVAEQDLDRAAAAAKADDLEVEAEQLRDQPPGLQHRRPAYPQGRVAERRRPEPEVTLGAGRPVAVDHGDRASEQTLGQLAGVADGRRAADHRGIAAVEAADPEQPAQHVGEVGAEEATVGVQLVDDDVAERAQQPGPAGVVGQDAAVQHVWVGHHDVPALPDGAAQPGGRVPVEGGGAQAVAALGSQLPDQVAQPGELVLGEGLGREEPEGAAVRVAQPGVEDRDDETEGLTTGGRSDQGHVPAVQRRLDRLRLVGVGAVQAAGRERRDQLRVQPLRPGPEVGRLGGQDHLVGQPPLHPGLTTEVGDPLADGGSEGDGHEAAAYRTIVWKTTVRAARLVLPPPS